MNIIMGNRGDELIKNREYSTISVCSSSNSISSVIGSVTSYITEFFKTKFPDKFFKETYISTSMAASAIKKDYFSMKQRPYLFIQPQFDLSPGIMNDIPTLFHDTSYIFLNNLRANYNLVFEDNESGIRIFNAFKRTKVNFKIGIKVSTEIQGWNTISYIDQNFQNNGFFYLNQVFLNITVPPYIIQNIAQRKGWNLNEPLDNEKMQQYMLKYSYNGIEEITEPSTGNKAYIYKYPVNLLLNYPDLANTNKNMRNNVIQNSIVEYNIGVEFWTPAMFIMELDNIERFRNLKLINPSEIEEDKYRFSLILNEDYIPYSRDGRNMLMRRNFIPDVNVKCDIVDLKPVMPQNCYKVCNILKENHIKMSKVFTVDLYINGRIVNNINYKIDEKDFLLKTFDPLSNVTYTVVLYADMEVINKINILMEDDIEKSKELKEFIKELQKR